MRINYIFSKLYLYILFINGLTFESHVGFQKEPSPNFEYFLSYNLPVLRLRYFRNHDTCTEEKMFFRIHGSLVKKISFKHFLKAFLVVVMRVDGVVAPLLLVGNGHGRHRHQPVGHHGGGDSTPSKVGRRAVVGRGSNGSVIGRVMRQGAGVVVRAGQGRGGGEEVGVEAEAEELWVAINVVMAEGCAGRAGEETGNAALDAAGQLANALGDGQVGHGGGGEVDGGGYGRLLEDDLVGLAGDDLLMVGGGGVAVQHR